MGIFFILLVIISTQKLQKSNHTNSSNYLNQPTFTSVPIPTEKMDQLQQTVMKITPTSTDNNNTISKKPSSSCPGAPDQRLTVGSNARVCTKIDNVYIRKEPSKNSGILTSVVPGMVVNIIDGPECANDYSYWKVKLSNGMTGWMSEGGDKIDPYFLCPTFGTGSGSISGHLYYPSEMIPRGYVVAINIDTNEVVYIETQLNQFTFQIDNLQPGEYYVAFYLPYKSYPDKSTILVNAYTKYAYCNHASSDTVPTCNDHSLVPVKVYAGQTTENIHLLDYILTTDYGLPTNPINP